LPACGDAILHDGEECDDGDVTESGACVTGCALAYCGDGFVQRGVEGCDDANATDTDACRNSCVSATCGDGVIWAGEEQCDGSALGGATCSSLGFAGGGTLACSGSCSYNTGGCQDV
jgi:cysteine-rich repeat protein